MKEFNKWNALTPEKALQAKEALGERAPLSEGYIEGLLNDEQLVQEIKKEGYPTDEDTCDRIGERIGIDTNAVMEVSERLRTKHLH